MRARLSIEVPRSFALVVEKYRLHKVQLSEI